MGRSGHRASRSGLPVLLMSGYYDRAESLNGSSDSPVLVKPFSSDVLVKAVRQVLDRPVSNTGR